MSRFWLVSVAFGRKNRKSSDMVLFIEISSPSAVGMGKSGPSRGQGLEAAFTVARLKRAAPRIVMRIFSDASRVEISITFFLLYIA